MEKRIEVEGDEVCLKGGKGSWRIVHPLKNADGSYNWKNILIGGSWANLFKIGIVVAILLFIIYAYNHDIEMCRELIECGASCPTKYVPTINGFMP